MSRLISDRYRAHQQACLERFERLKANEEALNRIFIDIYGLQGELTPDVADRDVTVYRVIDAPSEEERKLPYVISMREEIASLLSYAVGCMLGRYSPYLDGLLFAGGRWDKDAIRARIEAAAPACDFYDPAQGPFLPDRDGIVPVTDDDYFDDDIVARTVEFVRKVYGADTLEENLRFLAEALGGGSAPPRDVLRAYYLNDFYRDHLRAYQKRPIYWLFDSGRQNALKALVYLHRYDRDTVARLRTDYVFEQQERLRTQLAGARQGGRSAAGAKRVQKLEKQLAELAKYEELAHHMADMRLPLDLDDGIKVNYAKMGDLVQKIK